MPSLDLQTPAPPAQAKAEISSTTPDWSREACTFAKWETSRRLIRSIRRYQYWKGKFGPIGFICSKFAILSHRFWSIVTASEVPLNSQLGGGLLLPHPSGVIINPGAKIGPNCLLNQQVTIGYGGKLPGNPTLGGHVDVGAGAKILGGITIGDHAKIGANAVVLQNVPSNATAVGVPARIIIKAPITDTSN